MNKKIIITGGIGFIGSSLALALIKKNYHVILYDIRDNNHGEKIYQFRKDITYIQGDVNNFKLLKNIFDSNKIDGIVHLAAVSRVVVAQSNPDDCIRTNINGTKTLLKSISHLSKKPWLIFGSSREVYGEANHLPVKESSKKQFVNIYGKSKIQGENLFSNFAKTYKTSTIILRFSNVYGNRFDLYDRVIPKFIQQIANGEEIIIEGGGQIIDFTFIDDTINRILNVINYINKNDFIINDFHILPGVGWSLNTLITLIELNLSKKAIIRINEKRNYDVEKFIGDRTKAEEFLGVMTFHSLKTGLDKAITRYLNPIMH